jgi:serine/threonine protein kinase
VALSPGTRLGAYEILSLIGSGGMGEVYRARDRRLNRVVAIKVPSEGLPADRERLARVDREARLLAALNHSNIGAIYGMEDVDGMPALVLEFVDGPTLAERIARAPIPIKETLLIAKQIASALEAAHAKGIVHRDLKPSNIKTAPNASVKVLDFGIAKVLTANATDYATTDQSTMTVGRTDARVIGTPAYMSPEQAQGLVVDQRTDIWAFGCVLYEMVTQRRAFSGQTRSDILAAVLERDPDWRAVPATISPNVTRLLKRCLKKDPKNRLHDIGDARLEIEECYATLDTPAEARRLRARSDRSFLLWSAVVALLLVTVGLTFRLLIGQPRDNRIVEFQMFPPEGVRFDGGAQISPDGTKVAFVGRSAGKTLIWLRSLDSGSAQPLADTEGGYAPFWSADSSSIGFFVVGRLKSVPVSGGTARVLCDISDPPATYTGTWNAQGSILFASSPRGQLLRVAASGGQPQAVPTFEAAHERGRQYPNFLPDGRHYLYLASGPAPERQAYVGMFDSAERDQLHGIESQAIYSTSGHVMFRRGTALLAQPFDATRLALTGEAVPIVEPFRVNGAFSISQTGTLAYQSVPDSLSQLAWFDRSGRQLALVGTKSEYTGRALSPNSRYIAYERGGFSSDIWVLDVEKNSTTPFSTRPPRDGDARLVSRVAGPVWSSDSRMIAFWWTYGLRAELHVRPFEAVGQDTLLLRTDDGTKFPRLSDWSRDGRYVMYTMRVPGKEGVSFKGDDVWALQLSGHQTPIRLTETPYHEANPKFSPDGHWIAYESDESGHFEVYVQSFSQAAHKQLVSTQGGTGARWSQDGKELFYVAPDLTMMAVPIRSAGSSLETGTPVSLFKQRDADPDYNVNADGRFLMRIITIQPMTVVVNWAESLRTRFRSK